LNNYLYRLELAELQNSYSSFQDEVKILKETLNDGMIQIFYFIYNNIRYLILNWILIWYYLASSKLSSKKTEIGNLKNSIQKKFVQLENEKDNNANTKEKLHKIKNEKLTLEQKIDEVYFLLKKKIKNKKLKIKNKK